MSGVNKAIILGRLGRDPEVRRLGNGDPVVNLRLATSETWKDKITGERKEKTEWHSIVIYNENLARVAEQYLRKGNQVYVEGQIQTRKWSDQAGVEKYTTEIVLGRFQGTLNLVERNERPATDPSEYGTTRTRDEAPRGGGSPSQGGRPNFDLDDDIPF